MARFVAQPVYQPINKVFTIRCWNKANF